MSAEDHVAGAGNMVGNPLNDPAIVGWADRVLRDHELDHDTALLLAGMLSELESRGIDRYDATASLDRVVTAEGHDPAAHELARRTVEGRHRPSDGFVNLTVRLVRTQGAGVIVEVGQHELSAAEAHELADAIAELAGLAEEAGEE